MSGFICPVCGGALQRLQTRYLCEQGHSYDIARKGYVNLLQSQQSGSKRHGDDRVMVQARKAFLRRGYYDPLRDRLCELAQRYFEPDNTVLDAGCGECFYTAALWRALQQRNPQMLGIDISKYALAAADLQGAPVQLAVASIFRLSVASQSCGLLSNVFAPVCAAEFARVLRPGGFLIRAVPMPLHLYTLKAAVYDRPYENKQPPGQLEGFVLRRRETLEYPMQLPDGQTIRELFQMTPYYYKTGAQDFQRLTKLDHLETQAAFYLLVYQRTMK